MNKTATLVITMATLILMFIASIAYTELSTTGPATRPVRRDKDGNSQYTPEDIQRIRRYLEREAIRNNGNFIIEGTIRDENNKPLTNVFASIDKSKYITYEKSNHTSERFTVSGQFALRYEGYKHINIMFRKEGYYTVDRNFVLPKPDRNGGRFDPDQPLSKDTERICRVTDWDVVMEPHGTIPLMRPGDVGAIFVDKTNPYAIELDVDGAGLRYKTYELKGAQEPPPNAIVMWADIDDNGKVKTVKLPQAVDPGDNPGFPLPPITLPAQVHLKFTGKDGGFQRFGKPGEILLFRQMKDAPENGYEQELIFGKEDWLSLSSTTFGAKGRYFYLKWGDRYGKAKINASVNHHGKVFIDIEIYQHEKADKDRNVRTREYYK